MANEININGFRDYILSESYIGNTEEQSIKNLLTFPLSKNQEITKYPEIEISKRIELCILPMLNITANPQDLLKIETCAKKLIGNFPDEESKELYEVLLADSIQFRQKELAERPDLQPKHENDLNKEATPNRQEELAEHLDSQLFPEYVNGLEAIPKRGYSCLDILKERRARFSYIPFDQGALAEILQPTWIGSCGVLCWSWLYRKLESENILEPTSYKITDSHLPHPVIVGDNARFGDDVIAITKNLAQYLATHPDEIQQRRLEKEVQSKMEISKKIEADPRKLTKAEEILGAEASMRAEALITYLRKEIRLGDDSKAVYLSACVELEDSLVAHACAFVKTGDRCAWFDPNHGELSFDSFDDFAHWFRKETTYGGGEIMAGEKTKPGSLLFILGTSSPRITSFATLSNAPRFTEEEKASANPLSQKIIARREAATDKNVVHMGGYTLKTYSFSSSKHRKFRQEAPPFEFLYTDDPMFRFRR